METILGKKGVFISDIYFSMPQLKQCVGWMRKDVSIQEQRLGMVTNDG
jgi:hypothetical protein